MAHFILYKKPETKVKVTRANFGNCHWVNHRKPERLKYEYLQQNLLSLEIAKSEISQLSVRLLSVGVKMGIKYSLNFYGGRHKGQLMCILSVTESNSKEGLLRLNSGWRQNRNVLIFQLTLSFWDDILQLKRLLRGYNWAPVSMELTNYLSSMQFVRGMLVTRVIWGHAVNCINWSRQLITSFKSLKQKTGVQQTWRTTAYEKISKFVSLNFFCF